MTITSGIVRAREAVIPLSIENHSGSPVHLIAALDTGFTGFLALPPSLVQQLNLTTAGNRTVMLANGSVRMHTTYLASVIWHDRLRLVRVFGMGDKPLIGMALLNGSKVTLNVVEDGPVTIEPLAA